MVLLSSSLPSSPAPPRPLIGHPLRSGIHHRVLCRRAEPVACTTLQRRRGRCRSGCAAEMAAGAGASAGAGAGAGVQASRCATWAAAGRSRSVFVALRVSVLLAACKRVAWAVLSQNAAVHNLSTCLHTCRRVCLHGCALHLGLCWVLCLCNSPCLWYWTGWSCRRKPHDKCLKWAQVIQFRALRAPCSKSNTTWPKIQLFHRGEAEFFSGRTRTKS